MKKILLFLSLVTLSFGIVQTKPILTTDKIRKIEQENIDLKRQISELEVVVNNMKDVKEASNIYSNVDQFYNSAWQKLLWTLGVIGGIGALLFNKYTNNIKFEIEKSRQEIKEYTNERIKNYEDLIANYKNNTINEVEKKVNNIIEDKFKYLDQKLDEEGKKLDSMNIKLEISEKKLNNIDKKVNEEKNRKRLSLG